PACFTPSPKIVSTVVRFTPHENPKINCDINKLENVVKILFGNRRKMIRGLIKNPEILHISGIDETKRAEDLSIIEFCKLSEFF
ncbi:MAG: 16S rRNA (adenine(1518)-N(6)/adenine(1519)-N(6))-dimethyltransferase, partial [Rickettsiales bacterium]|nr:16S rRNA (adenine(1518)-N(6)/adenine(1519)-N(6))-dimethyltransferase [Rickettsiales bacterium]